MENSNKFRKDSLTKLQDQMPVYQRVYSDWKPTIEKMDVVRTMEAIAGKCLIRFTKLTK